MTPSDLDPQAIREVTEQVLSAPEYQPAQPGLLERAIEAIVDAVARVLGPVLTGAGGAVGTAVLIAVVLAIGVIAFVLVRRVRPDRARAPQPGRIGGRTADDWRREAAGHAGREAWAPALRCHYRALLADLVEAGIVDEVPGRTAQGYLREVVAAAPAAAPPMTAVTAAFEAAWYEGAAVTADDVARLRADAERVERNLLVPT